jgi:putative ABC transport system ATP-binding protein
MSVALVEATALRREHKVGGESIVALARVDLTVQRGEFVAVMGPSGSGKSTLLNILGCLDRPTGGSYRLAGEDTARLDAAALAGLRNRRIGFCFQSFNLLPRATAVQNVALPLIYAGVPLRRREELARAMLTEVALAERFSHRPTQLSGGQQQRVAIARALVTDPDLLLADEPTGTLDSRTGAEVMSLLQRLHARGRTLILVTHDPGIAGYAERIVCLRDGRVEADEPSPRCRRIPARAERLELA